MAWAEPGGTVHVNLPTGAGVTLKRRKVPVSSLPSTYDACIGRDELIGRISAARSTVELSGPWGIGKTNLARFAAHAARDGVDAVYYTDRADSVVDILLGVLSCFFKWKEGGIPARNRILEELQKRRTLVVLDNTALNRDVVEQVANAIGASTVVVHSSLTPQLAAGSELILLTGLDADAAIELASSRLRKRFDDDEHDALRRFSQAVGGHPYNFLRTVSAVAASGARLTAEALSAEAQSKDDLTDADRHMLRILNCFGGAAVPIDELEALCEREEIKVASIIDRLERAGWVERHSPRVSLREQPDLEQVDRELLRDVLRHFATPSVRAVRGNPRGPAARFRAMWMWLTRRSARTAVERERTADAAEAVLGSLRTGSAVGVWDAVQETAFAVTPFFGQSGLAGAWDTATSHAVEATERLEQPLAHARALQERACYVAVVDDPREAAPLFAHALEAAQSALGRDERLETLISQNYDAVARRVDTEHVHASRGGGDEMADDSAPEGWMAASEGRSETGRWSEGIKAVLAGVGAIVLLGIAALLILGLKLESSEATVSVATAAFGVVGSIVGAYFGVKIGSEQAAAATDQNADLTKRVQAAETKADAYALHVGDADKAQKAAQDMLEAVQSAVK